MKSTWAAVVFVYAVFGTLAVAQTVRGSIGGTVMDAQSKPVADAQVESAEDKTL